MLLTRVSSRAAITPTFGASRRVVDRGLAEAVRKRQLLDRHFNELLDTAETLHFIGDDKSESLSLALSASRATDSVDIVLGVARDIIVDDNIDIWDVDAACDDVGCDKNLNITIAELPKHLLAFRLFEIGVNDARIEALATKREA